MRSGPDDASHERPYPFDPSARPDERAIERHGPSHARPRANPARRAARMQPSEICFEVGLRRAHVVPVGAANEGTKDGAACKGGDKYSIDQSAARRKTIAQTRSHHVDAEELAALLLQSKSVLAHAHDAARRVEPYRSLSSRERLHSERRLRHVSGVKAHEGTHVQPSDHVGVPNEDISFTQKGASMSKSPGRSEKLGLVRQGDIARLRMDECAQIVGSVVCIDHHTFEARIAQSAEHVCENGPIADGNERFRATSAHGAKPCAQSGRENHCRKGERHTPRVAAKLVAVLEA